MASARPIRWLHLSDLHLGCRGKELWWQVETELARDVRAMVEKRGAGPDLILFSGDLTFKGDKKEFELVERFLDASAVGCARPGAWPIRSSWLCPATMTWYGRREPTRSRFVPSTIGVHGG